ncbi:MAG: acetyltransferase, N-acetylglutamate synthase [Microbacteriaceae bacterium]|nr:acetyltransferase, N-acetylglutamate synthase [Microbacteriaceae bacterium]
MDQNEVIRWREVSTDDAAAHRLLTEYFDSRVAGVPDGQYRKRLSPAADFVPPNGSFLILERGGVDAGCGGIRKLDANDPVVMFEVKHLFVRPSARGLGLGRLLLEELEERAVRLGATELVLDTNASLEAAAGLYRSSGFFDVPAYNDNPNATNWYRKELVG